MVERLPEEMIQRNPALDNVRAPLRMRWQRANEPLPQEWWEASSTLIDTAVNSGNQILAKACWCLRQVGGIQDLYLSAYAVLGKWC